MGFIQGYEPIAVLVQSGFSDVVYEVIDHRKQGKVATGASTHHMINKENATELNC